MRRRQLIPENEVGGPVSFKQLLARSADVAVFLDSVKVFSTGLKLSFGIAVRVVPGPEGLGRATSLPIWADRTGDGAMLVGVKLADGRSAMNVGNELADGSSADDQLALTSTGSSGSNNVASIQYFLTPMPPAEPLTVVLAWPKHGIKETAVTVEGGRSRLERADS